MVRARQPGFLAVVLCLFVAGALRADPEPPPAEPAAKKGFFERDSPLPDPDGLRAKLADKGITLGLIYTGEVFGNPAGGFRQGTVYDGLVTGGVDVDFGKLAGWNGLKFHALAYETHGPSGTNVYSHDLNRFSSLDAYDSVRLFELWAQASFFDNAINLRIGQQSNDAEFATTIGGALFIHSNFGAAPPTETLNMPSPTYPDAVPAVRLRLNSPGGRFYVQSGVYAGNANADREGDPSSDFHRGTAYNDNGTRFPISGNQGLLLNYEAGCLLNYHPDDPGLPGAYRIGGSYHSGKFSDDFLYVADPYLARSARPMDLRVHHGNNSVYAVAEQVVYRPRNPKGGNEDVATSAAAPIGNAEDSPLTAGAALIPAGPELRVFGALGVGQGDRSLTDFYVEAGLNYRSPLPGREQDFFGLGFTYTSLSQDARRLTREANRLDGTHLPSPDYENILEVTYQANLSPWLSVQPDLQYIVHTGGSSRYGNALIIGVRTGITF